MTIKFNKESGLKIVFFVLIVSLLGLEGLKQINPTLYKIVFHYGKLVALCVIVCLFVCHFWGRKNEFRQTAVLFMLLVAVNVFITICMSGNAYGCVNNYICAIGLTLLIIIYNKKIHIILDVCFFYLFFILGLNLICILMFPNGMYKSIGIEGYTANWLLGYKSSLQYYVLPAFGIALIRMKNRNSMVFEVLTIVISHVSAILSSNKMLLVGILILDVLVFTFCSKRTSVFNAFTYGIIVFSANVFFVKKIYNKIPLISYILMNVLHKNLRTGREPLWELTLAWIRNSWLFGYGNTDSNVRYGMYRFVSHSHNQILEFLYQGGICLLSVYIVLIIYIIYKLMQYKDRPTAQILSACLFVLHIMACVEIFTRNISTMIWVLFILVDYIPEIEEQYCKVKA